VLAPVTSQEVVLIVLDIKNAGTHKYFEQDLLASGFKAGKASSTGSPQPPIPGTGPRETGN
jgi:hypothetical protein